LINGETETGITIMQMDEGIDTGDILLQDRIAVAPTDTAGTLSVKLAALGGTALGKTLDLLRRDKLKPVKQDEKQASFAPLLKKEDGLVDWSQSAMKISCLMRGLDPWPATYTTLSGRRLRLFSPEVVDKHSCQKNFSEPGIVCRADRHGLLVTTGHDGCLLIKEVQPEGSRRMDVHAYISGRPIQPGTILGP
jgi:methionyl-tRNA formyltransferase